MIHLLKPKSKVKDCEIFEKLTIAQYFECQINTNEQKIYLVILQSQELKFFPQLFTYLI